MTTHDPRRSDPGADDAPFRPRGRKPAAPPPRAGFIDERTRPSMLPREEHYPALYDSADATAFQSLANGTASSHQQQRVIEWLLYASGVDDEPYMPGDTHATTYKLGRRSVGTQVRKLLKFRNTPRGNP